MIGAIKYTSLIILKIQILPDQKDIYNENWYYRASAVRQENTL